MIRALSANSCVLQALANETPLSWDGGLPPVWVDLLSPTADEVKYVEQAAGIDIPTREEMQEIETTSRLYEWKGNLYLTILVVTHADDIIAHNTPVTFILTPQSLITLRFAQPRSWTLFEQKLATEKADAASPTKLFLAILETIIDRAADIAEHIAASVDALAHQVFHPVETVGADTQKNHDYAALIRAIGRSNVMMSKLRESLMSIERLLVFAAVQPYFQTAANPSERLRALVSDVHSLNDHLGFLSDKLTFILDGTLGLISMQQNNIIKIFSIAAVVFLPPTLIASIYGMNFAHMPELDWVAGYPLALGLMVISALVPYLLFKRRGLLK